MPTTCHTLHLIGATEEQLERVRAAAAAAGVELVVKAGWSPLPSGDPREVLGVADLVRQQGLAKVFRGWIDSILSKGTYGRGRPITNADQALAQMLAGIAETTRAIACERDEAFQDIDAVITEVGNMTPPGVAPEAWREALAVFRTEAGRAYHNPPQRRR